MPREERRVDARLLRTRDLIDLRLDAPGCTIEPTVGGRRACRRARRLPDRPLPAAAPRRGGLAGGRPATPAGDAPAAVGPRGGRPHEARLRAARGHPDHVHAREGARGAPHADPAGLSARDAGGGVHPRRARCRAANGARDRNRSPLPPGRLPERPRRVPPLGDPGRAGRSRRALAHPPDGPAGRWLARRRGRRPAHRPRTVEPRQRAARAGLRPAARASSTATPSSTRPTVANPATRRRRCWSATCRCPALAPGSTGSRAGSSRRTSSTTATRRSWVATATCAWRTRASCSRSGTGASW